jgi:hypothetical protein
VNLPNPRHPRSIPKMVFIFIAILIYNDGKINQKIWLFYGVKKLSQGKIKGY